MAKAIWNGAVVAESDATVEVDGNQYFPPDSIREEFFSRSDHATVCGWKGTARYYTVSVDGETARNAAWYYPEPKQAASDIRDHIAFYPVVQVS